ncbi:two-component regulator propeller domain-containing protein [Bacteroides sp. CR5/BHMF/2]|nr:two-component regulator propeller domain-containing protein [Bacteroides sp. CR5/BHMF/2]
MNKESIWVITSSHLIVISRKNLARQDVLFSFSRGKCISGDSDGNIWVGTWDGAFRISATREITHYRDDSREKGLSNNQVRCILEDNFKRIWIRDLPWARLL